MKNYKKLLGLFAAFLLIGQAAMAEPLKPAVIAVVNMQAILEQSNPAKSLQNKINAKMKSIKVSVNSKAGELDSEEAELKKKSALLTPDAFKKEKDAFEKKASSIQKDLIGQKRKIDASFDAGLNTIKTAALQIIADVAKEKGANIVLSNASSQLVLSDSALDITDVVLKRLNEKLPDVVLKE